MPLISRDLMIYFRDENECHKATETLSRTLVKGQRLFSYSEETHCRLFVQVAYTLPTDPGTSIESPGCEKPLLFSDLLQLVTFKTGHHHNAGFAFIPRNYAAMVETEADGQLRLEKVHAMLLNIVRAATGLDFEGAVPRPIGLAV